MKSLKELYRIGTGPSSSHTMGPGFAAQRFLARFPEAASRSRLFLDPGPAKVTSPFGPRVHPITGETASFHNGVDLVLCIGGHMLETGIRAWADGTVLEAADTDGPAGTCVVLDHGRGLITRYFPLEFGSLRVHAGQRIRKGTLLGWMGKTGRSTGEHLHFQMELNGTPINPRGFMARS